ncbi:LytR C-terminal domain-containing protein [Nocardioides sp. InS609-2]|uniref:LytR C-terminal domain-containing protein n=1 Tax=Nocardioides sp. InS609-2 TaxID=2760705 RepID=UPI0020C0D11F|nr:LytR C-terminal domain-containing protein [Nocardioides sp. InS609-2]
MHRRDERGVAVPSPLVMLSIIAVAMAGIAFVATRDQPSDERRIETVSGPNETEAPVVTPTVEPTKPTKPTKAPKPQVKRGTVMVEVYNNSGIQGLAGTTAEKAVAAGWQVVGTDNWMGTIPSTTVYYPSRLEAAAKLLALDLGIDRVQPAVDPMRLDALTVVLTG